MGEAIKPTVITVQNVSKAFRLPHEKHHSIKSLVVNAFRSKRTFERQRVLKNISFEVKQGEFFGILGRNGSGKSTLLKLLAGIYSPDKGAIHVHGKLTPFIELGVGFNPELTGRENVYLNGALLGFNHREMNAMYQEIVDFAELEKFMDQKLKNYSSGMQVRLAFSIAIRAKSDILLFDEVLAVGDVNFQRKCIETFRDLKARGVTIVFVSHDLATVEEFCDRVALIDGGELLGVDTAANMTMQYRGLMADTRIIQDKTTNHAGTGEVFINKIDVLENGKTTTKLREGEAFSLRLSYEAKQPIKDPVFGLAIVDDKGVPVLGPNTAETGEKIGTIEGKGSLTARFKTNPLAPGHYTFMASCFPADFQTPYDFVHKIGNLQIIGKERHGSIYIEPDWSTTHKTS